MSIPIIVPASVPDVLLLRGRFCDSVSRNREPDFGQESAFDQHSCSKPKVGLPLKTHY